MVLIFDGLCRGLCLNEYGMGEKYDKADENPNGFKPGTLKVVKSEADIFKILGFPPVSTSLSRKHRLPTTAPGADACTV